MPLRVKDFGGLIPKLGVTKLPENAAQSAINVDLTSNTLRPINVVGDFIDSTNYPAIPDNEVFKIEEPSAPSIRRMLDMSWGLTQWLKAEAYVIINRFEDVINEDDVQTTFQETYLQKMKRGPVTSDSVSLVSRNDTGAVVSKKFRHRYTMAEGYRYSVSGPFFKFRLNRHSGGGPELNISIPEQENLSMRMFPRERVPLINNNNPESVYGFFEIEDCDVMPFDENRFYQIPENFSSNDKYLDLELGTIKFKLNFNYINNKIQSYYYVRSFVKDREGEIDGPVSELSDKILVRPGQIPELYTPLEHGFSDQNLYRSSTGGDDFKLLATQEDMIMHDPDAPNSNTVLPYQYYEDFFDKPLTYPIPPYGNFPETNLEEFLRGSFIHPAQFGVSFLGKNLYLSDFYKLYVWPEENTLPFQEDIKAIMLSGNTIIVFSGKNVFAVSGGNPTRMSKYLISNSAPLLNIDSLCQLNNSIFYVSNDGLYVISSHSSQNITKDFYTRSEWSSLNPQDMKLKTNDNSIFIESSDINLRFDLDEGIKALSTYDNINSSFFTWKTKKFHFDKKEVFDYVRIDADEDVTLKIYADNLLVSEYLVKNYNPFILDGTAHAYDWEFEVISSGEIRGIDLFEREILPVSDSVSLNNSNVKVWQNIWLKFPDNGSFSGGILTCELSDPIQIEFYHESQGLIYIHTVHSGRLFELPEDMISGNLWRISILGGDIPIESLVLFSRKREIITDYIHEFRADPNVQPWSLKVYDSLKPISFSSAQIISTGYPVKMTIYSNGNPSNEIVFNDSKPIRLPRMRPEKKFSFVIQEDEHLVREFSISTSMAKLKR